MYINISKLLLGAVAAFVLSVSAGASENIKTEISANVGSSEAWGLSGVVGKKINDEFAVFGKAKMSKYTNIFERMNYSAENQQISYYFLPLVPYQYAEIHSRIIDTGIMYSICPGFSVYAGAGAISNSAHQELSMENAEAIVTAGFTLKNQIMPTILLVEGYAGANNSGLKSSLPVFSFGNLKDEIVLSVYSEVNKLTLIQNLEGNQFKDSKTRTNVGLQAHYHF